MKALIVDDEQHCRENLLFLINKYCKEITEVETSNSVEDALDKLENYEPEIIFLDVQMPEEDGFHLLKEVDTTSISVIFVTAHDEFALKAIKCGPTAYILKPVDIEELQDAVKVSLELLENRKPENKIYELAIDELTDLLENRKAPDKICLIHASKLQVVNLKEVILVSSDSYYSTFELTDGAKITMAKTLKSYEEALGNNFIRVHRSFLVNVNHIEEYSFEDAKVKLTNGNRISVSRRKTTDLVERLKKIM